MPRKKQAVHASGLVEVKVTVGKSYDGKRIQKSFYGTSKLAAREKADEYLLKQAVAEKTGEMFIAKEYTFEEWGKKWLQGKDGTVKPRTFETNYKANFENHLDPYFGNAKINNIKQADIQAFFSEHSSMSKSTLNKFHIILHGIFESAIDNDLCFKNPVKNIKMSSNPVKEKRTYSKFDRDKILKYCIQHEIADIFLLLKTGVRKSEFLALQWNDIDFKHKTLSVEKAVTIENKLGVIGATKTESGKRIIPLDQETISFLKPKFTDGQFICGGEHFMHPNTYERVYQRVMGGICKDLGIESLNIHELRHTFGTLLWESGVDIYTIQKLMGHSSIAVTAKIYIHDDIESLRKAMKI